ncbi:hypothetical protein QJS04_geneDACA012730 [Acorus gramineus]|uniref:RNase H type-1 domain-containing protein n=1 Tax=Acorus gramineus TaxID=55184 RepID=A0AAV9A1R5_ACOGR|nr:hypothetical protein QJS04_geneDACA012730 [Acorus gramineus]
MCELQEQHFKLCELQIDCAAAFVDGLSKGRADAFMTMRDQMKELSNSLTNCVEKNYNCGYRQGYEDRSSNVCPRIATDPPPGRDSSPNDGFVPTRWTNSDLSRHCDLRRAEAPRITGEDIIADLTHTKQQVCAVSDYRLVSWTLHVDGASNRKGSGAGLILRSEDGFLFEHAIKLGFKASNNKAEYEALIAGLEFTVDLTVHKLVIYSDSELVVYQSTGDYRMKDDRMAAYQGYTRTLLEQIGEWEIHAIDREQNTHADVLANLARALEGEPSREIQVDFLGEPSIAHLEQVMAVESTTRDPTWMDPILCYLKEDFLPADKEEARKIMSRSAWFLISNQDVLYKQSFQGPLLRCVNLEEVTRKGRAELVRRLKVLKGSQTEGEGTNKTPPHDRDEERDNLPLCLPSLEGPRPYGGRDDGINKRPLEWVPVKAIEAGAKGVSKDAEHGSPASKAAPDGATDVVMKGASITAETTGGILAGVEAHVESTLQHLGWGHLRRGNNHKH